MPEAPSKSLDFFARIAIPLLAFVGGMFVQYAIASRTFTQQEFATATTIATNEQAQKNEKLKEWADIVIAQYVAEKKQSQQSRQEPLPVTPSKEMFLVSRSIAESVCLFPKEGFGEPYGSFIIDTIDNHPEKIRGMDAREVLVKAVADYRMVRNQYESTLSILKDSCGFLLRRDK